MTLFIRLLLSACRHKIRMRRLRSPLILFLLIRLFSTIPVFAESKHVFPQIDGGDFEDYVNHEAQKTDGRVHIFSSLSVVNLRKESVVFKMTGKPHEAIMSLSETKSYPGMRDEIRSEYFDVTVWGQMENYFNRDLEVIQKENEIIAILNELNEVNERYLALLKNKPKAFNPDYTVTLDRLNYFNYSYASKTSSGKKHKSASKPKDRSSSQREEGVLAEVDYSTPVSIRLKDDVFTQGVRSSDGTYSENAGRVTINTPSIRLSSDVKKESTWISSIFENIGRLYVYVLNNKIISTIVFTLLFLFLKFILKIFMVVFLRA